MATNHHASNQTVTITDAVFNAGNFVSLVNSDKISPTFTLADKQ